MFTAGFLITLCYGLSEATTSCGRAAISPKFSRIVGGHVAVPGSWPWLVMLNEIGLQACGGALIHPYWVATASHCFEEVSRNPSRWDAYVGKFHMSTRDTTEQKVGVRKIITHPSYDNETMENDIALMLLEHPVHYNSHVSPLCLPDSPKYHLNQGDVCVVAGWGETQGTSPNASVLNQVRLPILTDDVCGRSDWYGSEYYPATMICAGYEYGGHDTCQGDSGGPFMCDVDGTYYMTGVTSWGIECARPKQPGVYTDTSLYTHWIKDTMSRNGHPF